MSGVDRDRDADYYNTILWRRDKASLADAMKANLKPKQTDNDSEGKNLDTLFSFEIKLKSIDRHMSKIASGQGLARGRQNSDIMPKSRTDISIPTHQGNCQGDIGMDIPPHSQSNVFILQFVPAWIPSGYLSKSIC